MWELPSVGASVVSSLGVVCVNVSSVSCSGCPFTAATFSKWRYQSSQFLVPSKVSGRTTGLAVFAARSSPRPAASPSGSAILPTTPM